MENKQTSWNMLILIINDKKGVIRYDGINLCACEVDSYADAKEEKPDAQDGSLRRLSDTRPLCPAGQVAGADARSGGAAGGAGLRQGRVHRQDRRQ